MSILSSGNSKIGKMLNVSMSPVLSCGVAGQTCGKKCYAQKAYRQYPSVKKLWDANYTKANSNLGGYFTEIKNELLKVSAKNRKWFRWHVAGDILGKKYLQGMCLLAIEFPDTKFLAFTKQYEIVNKYIFDGNKVPDNLVLVFSAWPGIALDNLYHLPVAWMDDGTDKRLPASALECPGACEDCMCCFNLPTLGRDVKFAVH